MCLCRVSSFTEWTVSVDLLIIYRVYRVFADRDLILELALFFCIFFHFFLLWKPTSRHAAMFLSAHLSDLFLRCDALECVYE